MAGKTARNYNIKIKIDRNMKKNISLALLLLATLFTACKDAGQEETTTSAAVTTTQPPATQPQWDQPQSSNAVLPNMQLEDAAGNSHNLQTFKGKKVFFNIWASWCPPCKAEMPSIEKLYKSVDANKAAFVMLTVDDKFQTAKDYVRSAKLDLPVYFAQGDLPQLFQVEGIPATFIFDENGVLVQQIVGSRDYDTDEFRAMFQ